MHKNPDHRPSTHPELDQLRRELLQLDEQIVALLNKRAELSLKIGQIKSSNKENVYKPFREKELLQELEENNSGPLPGRHLRAIYREIFSSSRSLQNPQYIVYLGPEGTFSHFAGIYYLGHSATFQPKSDLNQVFSSVRNQEASMGIIPLENSLQGTVGQSLDLFMQYEVYIQAEIYCRISHSLLGKSDRLEEIETIFSHPQALQQCSRWISTNLPRARIIPTESTASAAKKIEDKSQAAIAHPGLREKYDLKLLKREIEDIPENWTRFLLIGHDRSFSGNKDKTSLLFTIPDKPGSLVRILSILASKGVNMKKLESRPIKNEKWQYIFFVDVECDLNRDEYSKMIQDLSHACYSMRILGSYPHGSQIDLTKDINHEPEHKSPCE